MTSRDLEVQDRTTVHWWLIISKAITFFYIFV